MDFSVGKVELCVRVFATLYDLSYLQLQQCETSSCSRASVVLYGWTLDLWSQLVDWSRSNGSSL